MRLDGSRIVLTGASGGIGRALALALAARGARLTLSGRSAATLEEIAVEVRAAGGAAEAIAADLVTADGAAILLRRALAAEPRIDLLVNAAGALHFGAFEQTPEAVLEALWRTNVLAPMRLTRAVLPVMRAQNEGLIVNVGSVFGSIAFPYFTAYSATKSALRGFSEALRRELCGSGVEVLYVAPRYTRTALNAGAPQRMAEALGMNQDEPAAVAAQIVEAIETRCRERYLGWPEKLFVRINALLPRLVDRALRSQTRRMRPFALEQSPAPATVTALPTRTPT